MERGINSENAVRPTPRPAAPPDEALVTDARAGLTPAQVVEHKLVSLLNSTPLALSRLTTSRGQPRPRL